MIYDIPNLSSKETTTLKQLREDSLHSNFYIIQACRTDDGRVSAMGIGLAPPSDGAIISQELLEHRVDRMLDELPSVPANSKIVLMVHPDSKSIEDVHLSVCQFVGASDPFAPWLNERATSWDDQLILPLAASK